MSADRALFNRFPALREVLPFRQLANLPTPVHRNSELEDATGVERIWVKRDDISAKIYGGNKVRKLEFLLAAALQNRCSTVITFGGLGSNHALATAINCRELGLKCVAILTPEPATDAVRRTLRYHLMLGTRIEVAHSYEDAMGTAARVRGELGAANCYEIPFGGSSWLGSIGFVNAGLELAQQIKSGGCATPDVIYVPCGTTGTIAGLGIGLQLAGLQCSIEALQVTPDSMQPLRLFKQLYAETVRELRARQPSIGPLAVDDSGVTVRNDQLGGGYALPTDAAHEAIRLMQGSGMSASLTYTAKAMAGLMADAGRGLLAGKNVLFWNTYNSQPYPALPDDDSWRKLPKDLHNIFSNELL